MFHFLEKIDLQARRGTLWKGSISQPSPGSAVLFLHGMESHAGWFQKIAQILGQRGVATFAWDRESRGGRDDAKQVLREEMQRLSEWFSGRFARCVLLGNSWGGLWALSQILEDQTAWDRIVAINPGLYPKISFSAWTLLRAFFRDPLFKLSKVEIPICVEQFSARPEIQEFITRDPLRRKETSFQHLISTWNMQVRLQREIEKLLPKELSTLLLILSYEDKIVDNNSMFSLCQKLNISHRIHRNSGHALLLEEPFYIAEQIMHLFPNLHGSSS